MAIAKVDDETLLQQLTEVFRSHGYEGASLSRISTATGLEKASLYHRYPGGKEAMAMAVVTAVGQWFEENVIAILRAEGDPQQRIARAAARLRDFYGRGSKPCILDTLSLCGGSDTVIEALRGAMAALIQAFAAVSRESGLPAPAARSRAEQAVLQIEGSLVLARVLGDRKPFLQTLDRLPELLTQAPGPGQS